MPTTLTTKSMYGDEDGWVSVNVDGRTNLKRKGHVDQTSSPTKQSKSVNQSHSLPSKTSDEHADDVLFQTLCNSMRSGASRSKAQTAAGGLSTLMQSQYFSPPGEDHAPNEPVSLLSMHPIDQGPNDPLEELFNDDCGYLDEEPSEPSSDSLTSSLMDELESSVTKADSKNIAVAFASIARKSEEKGQPTIISMRLVPKTTSANGLSVSADSEQDQSRGQMYNRFSVLGPIDLADPEEMAQLMSENTHNAYLVTECHPGPSREAFAGMDSELQSDLLWDWSLFREDSPRRTDGDETMNQAGGSAPARGRDKILGDLLENSLLFPMTKRIFWERMLPTLITTHVVSVLVGVVIGRRLCAPQNRR